MKHANKFKKNSQKNLIKILLIYQKILEVVRERKNKDKDKRCILQIFMGNENGNNSNDNLYYIGKFYFTNFCVFFM